MDISRLQLQSLGLASTVSDLPPGLRTPLERAPHPAIQQTATSLALMPDHAADIPAQVFDHFAAAWKARVDRFLTEDPISRA